MAVKDIVFDLSDLDAMRRFMKERARKFPYVGTNEDGERILLNISSDSITLVTLQSNNWVRTNIYYPDGSSEEMYER